MGKQDQYAAAFGGVNYFQFNEDESVVIKPINMNANYLNIILIILYLCFGLNY